MGVTTCFLLVALAVFVECSVVYNRRVARPTYRNPVHRPGSGAGSLGRLVAGGRVAGTRYSGGSRGGGSAVLGRQYYDVCDCPLGQECRGDPGRYWCEPQTGYQNSRRGGSAVSGRQYYDVCDCPQGQECRRDGPAGRFWCEPIIGYTGGSRVGSSNRRGSRLGGLNPSGYGNTQGSQISCTYIPDWVIGRCGRNILAGEANYHNTVFYAVYTTENTKDGIHQPICTLKQFSKIKTGCDPLEHRGSVFDSLDECKHACGLHYTH